MMNLPEKIENLILQFGPRAYPYQGMYQTLTKLGGKFNLFFGLKPFKSEDTVKIEDFLKEKSKVYFLYDENELVYIGATWRLTSRIQNHIQDGKKFDSFAFFECDDDSDGIGIFDLEGLLLNSYKTKYNKPVGRPIKEV